MENNNVILFPNTKEQLLDQMYQALNNEDYTLSLEKSKQLLCNCINLHDVNVVKLISLIHLNRFIEAEAFCEPLLQVQSPHKEEYLEYYYMILYSSQQYAQLITHYKQLQAESPHLSNQTELTLYYELAYQENNRNIHLLIDKIKNAYQSHDDRLIFHHIQRLITISDSPHHFMIHLVKQKDVHPVIKTELLLWFKSCGLNKEIVVEKFGSETKIIPDQLLEVEQIELYKKSMDEFSDIEQKNPTLYQMGLELLYQYCYVLYPYLTTERHAESVVRAMTHLLLVNFSQSKPKEDRQINQYVEEIMMAQKLYFTLFDWN